MPSPEILLQREVIRLANIVPREPSVPLPLGAEEYQLDAFAVTNGFPLPVGVREWLMYTDGPCIGFGGIHGLRDYKRTFGILPEFQERQWLPLGTDGCGDYYVLALNSEDLPLHPVYFIDSIREGYEKPSYVVASGFWRFLWFMFKHELGERGWPFNKGYVLAHDPDIATIKSAVLPWDAE